MEPIKTTFHNKFRIPSARADWHDYNGGAYFVTICAQNREHFFGEIENGEMVLSEIGDYVNQNISEIPQHNPYAEITLWVVMPDHVHMIVIINNDKIPHEKRFVDTKHYLNPVETFPETSQTKQINGGNETSYSKQIIGWNDKFQYLYCLDTIQKFNGFDTVQNMKNTETFRETSLQMEKPIVRATQMQSWLSVVVRQFKQSVTRFARTKQPYFAWQTRYYDRIIRNQDEMNRIAIYIENNVAKWGEGCEVDY